MHHYSVIFLNLIRKQKYTDVASMIFNWDKESDDKYEKWIRDCYDLPTDRQYSAFREVKSMIKENVAYINASLHNCVSIVETPKCYGLLLRLCQSIDQDLSIRSSLPHFLCELKEWQGNEYIEKSISAYKSDVYCNIEYLSLKKYLRNYIDNVSLSDVHLLPQDEFLRDNHKSSVAINLHAAFTRMCRSQCYHVKHKIFFVGPCVIVCHEDYVLNLFDYLINTHLTPLASLLVIADVNKKILSKLQQTLTRLRKHAVIKCFTALELVTLPVSCMAFEISLCI